MCVLMNMFDRSRYRRTLYLRRVYACCTRCRNLLAAIHTCHFIEAVRETEIAALFILDHVHTLERVVRPTVISVPPGMTHSD